MRIASLIASSTEIVCALGFGDDLVGRSHECGGAGARLVASLRERMAAVESTARRLASRPRVACIEWIEPLMSGGNWMPSSSP